MRTVGPVVLPVVAAVGSLAAVCAALCLLALAPIGWRLGWWSFGFALFSVIPAASVIGAVAAATALAALVLARSRLGWRTLVGQVAVLAVGAGVAYLPLRYDHLFRTLPPINDIATDTGNRPAFEVTVAGRAAESADRLETPDPELSDLQKAGYPDIAPLRTALPVSKAFDVALAVARGMARWTIVAVDRDRGRIEASARTPWFGFTDDIVIRVTAVQGGSCIDMRSASRKGSRDFGMNAARVRAYLGALAKAAGQLRQ